MGKVIRFFNYEAALEYYEGLMDHMRQWSTGQPGSVRTIAKPIMILSIIKGVREGVFSSNRFEYDKLNSIYEALFRKYFVQGRQVNLTPMSYPFYHLQTDKFWHLSWKGHRQLTTNSATRSWLERNVDYGYVDEELWLLLSNDDYANRLRDYLIEEKIVQKLDDVGLAAEPSLREGLKALAAALLMVI